MDGVLRAVVCDSVDTACFICVLNESTIEVVVLQLSKKNHNLQFIIYLQVSKK